MKVFFTYTKQRINFFKLAGLVLLLYIFSTTTLKQVEPFSLFFFFSALFFLRMYDDLMQYQNDIGKTNRDYTNSLIRSKLLIYLAGIFTLITITLFLFHITLAIGWVLFAAVNHVIYLLLKNNKKAYYLLPLFKYPALSIMSHCISEQFVAFTIPSLIFSFLLFLILFIFEGMEDPEFPFPKKTVYLAIILLYIPLLLLLPCWIFLILQLIFLTASIYLLRFTPKYSPYVFLAVITLSKLISNYYAF